MNNRLEEIKARYEDSCIKYQAAFNAGKTEEYVSIKALSELAADIPQLISDVECLQAELERVTGERDAAMRVRAYWDSLYGQGLEVANWHMNGETEPFDNFWFSADAEAQSHDAADENGEIKEDA